jgi:ketosteroid isomerase-like protein
MSGENVEMARRDYALVSRGDIDGWLRDLAEDVELHELPNIPDSAVYRGHEGVRKWAAGVLEVVQSWHWTPEEIVYEDDDLLIIRVRIELVGRGGGVPIDQVIFHVLRFHEGKGSVIQGFLSRREALNAAGLGE